MSVAADHRDPPDLLYHYTTPAGLEGILRTCTLWATDSAFLNDAQELVYAAETLTASLQAMLDLYGDTEVGSLEDALGSAIRSVLTYMNLPAYEQPTRVFVACLSEHPNQLSQWRAYGGPQGGYSIGFRTAPLPLLAPATDHISSSFDFVRYGAEASGVLLQHTIDRLMQHLLSNPNHPGVKGWDRYISDIVHTLASVKHPDFREEAEWRMMISADAAEIAFRTSGLGIVPYLPTSFERAAVNEIRVGPGPHPDLRRVAVAELLRVHGFTDVEILVSETPLRIYG